MNLVVPRQNSLTAASLQAGTTRSDVLLQMIPAMRLAVQQHGWLTEDEQGAWTRRDLSINRAIVAPIVGVVRGLERNGALRVEDSAAVVHELRAGSLLFA